MAPEGIVEVMETRSRRRANELLGLGYRLLSVDAVTFTFRAGHTEHWRRSHEYVFGRTVAQTPFGEVVEALYVEASVARQREAGREGRRDEAPLAAPAAPATTTGNR